MSCLFQSICTLLQADERPSDGDVRRALCDFMQHQSPKIQLCGETMATWIELANERNDGIENYIQRMRAPNEWGGAPELAAASFLFKIRVRVEQRGKTVAQFGCFDQAERADCLVLDYNGSHYTPLKREFYASASSSSSSSFSSLSSKTAHAARATALATGGGNASTTNRYLLQKKDAAAVRWQRRNQFTNEQKAAHQSCQCSVCASRRKRLSKPHADGTSDAAKPGGGN